MRGLTSVCLMAVVLQAQPTGAEPADQSLCNLGNSVVDYVNGLFAEHGRIEPGIVTASVAFLEVNVNCLLIILIPSL